MNTTARRLTRLFVALIASLAVFLLVASSARSALAREKAREPAPSFHAITMNGEKFNNESVKGKVVLLEFWTTWCGFCDRELPFVERLNAEFGNKGLLVLAIDVGESKTTVKKYLQAHPRKTRVVLTDDTNLAAMYGAGSYPVYVVIDREGNIAGEQKAALGEAALRELVAKGGLQGVDKDSGGGK